MAPGVLCVDLNGDNYDEVIITRNDPWEVINMNLFYRIVVYENETGY